ncbi:MAG: type III-A CRISPR-associated protein Cas10/Csm1 [Anaerolineae bacterium]
MDTSIYLAAVAGLLHDIGKVAHRANELPTIRWDDKTRQEFGRYHALLTYDFITQYVPERWRRTPFVQGASLHHRPTTRETAILALADRLASGERERSEQEQAPRQMQSIFSSIRLDESPEKTPEPLYWPLRPLELRKEVIFPGQPMDNGQADAAYRTMWQSLREDAQALRVTWDAGGPIEAYLESLLALLRRYLWCVPAAYYQSVPDVSLYDHARMTAALAAILAQSDEDPNALIQMARSPEAIRKPIAMLVGADISGVQDFIYTITSKGAASALRGRSFYLQLMTQALARFTLRRLGLPITNLIYAGGGNFYILAPAASEDALQRIQQDVSRILWQHHRGELYVAIAGVPLTSDDFFRHGVSGKWQELHSRLQVAKARRFSELEEQLVRIFEPQGTGGDEEKQCQVCGREHPRVKVEDDVRKCAPCRSYERLGERLRRARFLRFDVLPLDGVGGSETLADDGMAQDDESGRWEGVLSDLGLRVSVDEMPPQSVPDDAEWALWLALSDEALNDLTLQPKAAVGRWFLVNVTPTITPEEIKDLRQRGVEGLPQSEGIKPFSAMAAQAQGIKRLGVLRMDVDNLGRIFQQGLGDRATLSRVATLSFAISLFFEGWVGELARQHNCQDPVGERLYAIYSGGDDLFFVGSWDAVVELARAIRADLTPFAAGNPSIHASAGIALARDKYPLYQAARDALEAEEKAKEFVRWIDGAVQRKNAICFLGQALSWDLFGLEPCDAVGIETAHALMHRLEQMGSQGNGEHERAPRSLIRRLMQLHDMHREAQEARQREGIDLNRVGQPQVIWGPWMWQAAYLLKRMAEQTRNEEIDNLREQLQQSQFRSIEYIGLAARWAELKLRQQRD